MYEKNENKGRNLERLNLANIRCHIFLCCNQENSRCCSNRKSDEAWNYLKQRLIELGLRGKNGIVQCSKVNCLCVCANGPIAVVYPHGIWYHSCTPAVLESIIQQHILNNNILKEYVLGVNTSLIDNR